MPINKRPPIIKKQKPKNSPKSSRPFSKNREKNKVAMGAELPIRGKDTDASLCLRAVKKKNDPKINSAPEASARIITLAGRVTTPKGKIRTPRSPNKPDQKV